MHFINFIEDMLKSMLEDENGGTSTMRVIVSFSILIIISVWAIQSIRNNMLISFETKDLGLIGVLLGGKFFQKGIEVKKAISLKKNK